MARPGAPDEDLGADGRHRVVNSNLGPIRASNGSLAGAIHLAADVTAEVDAGHAASFTEIRSPEQDRWAAQRLQRALLPSKARHIAGVSARPATCRAGPTTSSAATGGICSTSARTASPSPSATSPATASTLPLSWDRPGPPSAPPPAQG